MRRLLTRRQQATLVLFLWLQVVAVACTQPPATSATPTSAVATPRVVDPTAATSSASDGGIIHLPRVQTEPSPVTGSLVIEEDRCCIGGVAGEPLPIEVVFAASSTAGEVMAMRTRTGTGGCANAVQMEEQSWESFVSTKTFYFTPPINWVTFFVSVDFRDDAGNVSPIYCDDIAVEGMPSH